MVTAGVLMRLKNNTENKKAADKLLQEMERTAEEIRSLIIGMPAEDLLGYIYSQLLMASSDAGESSTASENNSQNDLIGDSQFLLEYVHAVLVSEKEIDQVKLDEEKVKALFELCSKLKEQANNVCP